MKRHFREAHAGHLITGLFCTVDNCGKAFSRRDTMKRHIEKLHSA